jgi:hypothetical protein
MCPATGNHSSILFRLNDLNDGYGYGGGAAYGGGYVTGVLVKWVFTTNHDQGHDVDHASAMVKWRMVNLWYGHASHDSWESQHNGYANPEGLMTHILDFESNPTGGFQFIGLSLVIIIIHFIIQDFPL